MPVKINITDEDIVYAENILLSENQHFDNERKDFIKNLDTIDLQAVPGSGKTTALLAKLLILEKYLPFDDGSGILVISHTNAAVDEIRNKIAKCCPKLFSYPNFVGTIQSFVDGFLAIPCGHTLLGTCISWIDEEKYKNNILKKFKRIYWSNEYDKPGTLFWGRHIKKAKAEARRCSKSESEICNEYIDKEIQTLFYDYCDEKIKRIDNKEVILSDKNNKKFIGLKTIIEESVLEGIISYEYAFNIATFYLKQNPIIRTYIQKRFRYIFVDEMQDMDQHQYDLLEDIFFNNGDSISNYQRIGDKNQAIYNGSAKLDDIWKARESTLKLNGSYRLTKEVAELVKHFGLEFIDIEGRFQNSTGVNIKPIVIVFKDDSITNVIPEFVRLIKQLINEGKLPDNSLNSYKAIAWVKNKSEVKMIGLTDYWGDFDDNNQRPKEDYACMESYLLHYDKDKRILGSVRKNILNALLRILRYEDILIDNRNYSKQKLLSFLKENDEEQYEKLKLLLYLWSINIIRGKKNDVYSELKNYVSELLDIFGKSIVNSKKFIETTENRGQVTPPNVSGKLNNNNVYEKDGVKIEVTTIHAVKGQTHTATLYLETYYQRKYESERLREQFKGNSFRGTGKYDKQSTKMTYVGLSRPTHLLCLAVHINRFNKDDFKDKWDIIDITKTASTVVVPVI
ncbi:MAG: UvrD-helicase domain-containing protein [Candidatus Methanoperedens sp.]